MSSFINDVVESSNSNLNTTNKNNKENAISDTFINCNSFINATTATAPHPTTESSSSSSSISNQNIIKIIIIIVN